MKRDEMNRKQIVNQHLQWPEIDEPTSEKILEILESHLKKYPTLRRHKNPPKKYRKKKDTNVETSSTPQQDPKTSIIKSGIRFGINSVTKTIEREPSSVMFVLVCHSCKPLVVLTRHIQLMCAMENIPAGCIHNLSTRLKTVFNMNRISAILVKKTDACAQEVECMFNDWRSRITPLLPTLVAPFGAQFQADSIITLIEEIKREDKIGGQIDEIRARIRSDATKREDEFGMDFLRVDHDVKWLDFDDNRDFIIFK